MRVRFALLAALIAVAACTVQEKQPTPAPAKRLSGGGFSEAVPPPRKSVSSQPARPYLEGNLVANTTVAVNVPAGTPYLPENMEATRLCTADPTVDAKGVKTFPVKDRYSHMPKLGQFFTAWSCGLRRVRQLPSVVNSEYLAPLRLTLKAEPNEEFKKALFTAGFICKREIKGKGCTVWDMAENVRLDLLARLSKFTDQIKKDS